MPSISGRLADVARSGPHSRNEEEFAVKLRIGIATFALLAWVLSACSPEPAAPAAQQPAAILVEPAPAVGLPAGPPQQASAPAQPLPPALAVPAATAVPASTPMPTRQPVARVIEILAPTPAPEPVAVPVKYPVVVTDSNGDELVFEEEPERIVAFDSAVVEILFAIGEGHRVVGTHDFVFYPPEAADVPRLGGAFNMDIETTVALEPDLVFIFFDTFKEDLERAGLKVFYLATLTDEFTQVADRTRLWGNIVGNPEAADIVANDFEERVDAVVRTMNRFGAGPTVFQDEGDLWTPGQGTLIQQVFDLLRLENIAAEITGYAQLSPEVIVESDPAVIIASYGDNISTNPAFAGVLAVQNGAIYVPTSDALSIASPRFVKGIEDLAAWVYPGLFR